MTYSIVSQTCKEHSASTQAPAMSSRLTSAIDYEVATTCSIAIRATSADGSTADSTFVVEITDVNDVAPQYAATDANPDVSEGTTSVDTLPSQTRTRLAPTPAPSQGTTHCCSHAS